MKKTILYILLLCSFPMFSNAQPRILQGEVLDKQSEEPIPFAAIKFLRLGGGVLTDSAGRFTLQLNNWPAADTLHITSVGYTPLDLPVANFRDSSFLTIHITLLPPQREVVVKTKYNRALWFWRKIIAHKSQNDKHHFDNYGYEVYNKLELDLNRINKDKVKSIGPIRPFGFLLNNIDTSEGAPFLPVYLTETISDYYAQNSPFKSREIIKGSKTMGINNESVSKFLGGTDQNVNIYANFIPVFDKQFVSPLSDNGDNYYRYRVADTQYIGSQRFFHLIFQPKRKGENTFEGDCWVHDTTWAIQRMNLFLAKDANINFVEKLHLLQEYTLVSDSTWFLSKDKFVVDIAPLKTAFGFIGRKTTTYKNVAYNQPAITDSLNKNKRKRSFKDKKPVIPALKTRFEKRYFITFSVL